MKTWIAHQAVPMALLRPCSDFDGGASLWLLLAATLACAACGNRSGPPAVASTATATPSVTPTPTATATATPSVALAIVRPLNAQLSLSASVQVVVAVTPPDVPAEAMTAVLDGVPRTESFQVDSGEARMTLTGLSPGSHSLGVEVRHGQVMRRAEVSFETVTLTNPDDCEILNDAECFLPYPSSRFLAPADTRTGWRLSFPPAGMPQQWGQPLSPDPFRILDGFSPTVQILMHFPGGVDAEQSGASRLLPDTRTYSERSLDADSPTVLVDADTHERVIHFIENDGHATDPSRRVLFLRPGKSLTPGHRYIVAVRHLRHADGSPVAPEPAFAAWRDGRPSDIPAIVARRAHFEALFSTLAAHQVERADLILAFDFVVQSDAVLTGQMVSMRDQAFDWLDEQLAADATTFTVDTVDEADCAASGTVVWRLVTGTYQVPLFLTADPVADSSTPARLAIDGEGRPLRTGFTQPPFTIAIPCSVLASGGTPKPPLILGHGLFGNGRDFVTEVAGIGLGALEYIAAGTDWRGLSSPDLSGNLTRSFIGRVLLHLDEIAALPDRLRQGQLNTLVLARMLKANVFARVPAFRTPSGGSVLAGPDDEAFYFGASLGGIMGLMFAALSPDVTNTAIDVGAMNFSLLLQRATPFLLFQGALEFTGVTDPMQTALILGLIHELWVRGEAAGYATHVTSNPLPGTNAKHVLVTMAWLDQEVSNQGTEIAARTLGLPNLIGSLRTGLPQIPDRAGPLSSALVVYDTGSFDESNPDHAPFIPPLSNVPPQPNRCDPHGRRAFIPASIEQLLAFLQPHGQIVNYCTGICDAGDRFEIPYGAAQPCDPLP